MARQHHAVLRDDALLPYRNREVEKQLISEFSDIDEVCEIYLHGKYWRGVVVVTNSLNLTFDPLLTEYLEAAAATFWQGFCLSFQFTDIQQRGIGSLDYLLPNDAVLIYRR